MSVGDEQRLETFIHQNPSIKYFQLLWIDTVGISRVRVLTKSYLLHLVSSKQSFATLQSVFSRLQDDTPNGQQLCTAAGKAEVMPDFASLRPSGYRDGYASMMCTFQGEDGQPLTFDPRAALIKILDKLAGHGVMLRCGFELEFTLFDAETSTTKKVSPFERQWSSSRALTNRALDVLDDIISSLQRSDIGVMQFHAEYGPAQYEISTMPLPAKDATDTLMCTKETIHHVCEANMLDATFYPKPVSDGPGTGAHLHFSIEGCDSEDSFVAGILANLGSICAFSLPIVDSYARVEDSSWAGGTWMAWGTQNREVPLRKIEPGHWEFRVMDGTANVYLVLAAIVAAGIHGLKEHMPLAMHDCQGEDYFWIIARR